MSIRPVVADKNARRAVLRRFHADFNDRLLALPGIFDRIGNQVGEDLLDQGGINRGQGSSAMRQSMWRARNPAHIGQDFVDGGVEPDGLKLQTDVPSRERPSNPSTIRVMFWALARMRLTNSLAPSGFFEISSCNNCANESICRSGARKSCETE